MFGTLVVVLPSAHRGGELIVRHGGREVVVDLSGGEVSEVAFAAFCADCEHEVRPVAAGNRARGQDLADTIGQDSADTPGPARA